jgi:membrane-associated protein
MLPKLLELLRSIPAPLVVAAAFLAPCAETAMMIGLLVPGELVAVAAGVLAGRSRVPLPAVMAAAAAGAIVGDAVGYVVGRRNPEALSKRFSRPRWVRTRDYLKQRGLPAIFLARFTPFARSVMPPVAGAARVGFRRFLALSAASGILWGCGSVLLGYFAASQAARSLLWAGIGAAVLLGAILGVGVLSRRRKSRSSRDRRAA